MDAISTALTPSDTRPIVAAGDARADTGGVSRAGRRAGHEHRHHHHHGADGDGSDVASAAFVSLRAKVEQTLGSLTSGTAGGDAPQAADGASAGAETNGASFDADLKARLSISGPDGRVDLSVKVHLQAGDGSGAALQGFTEALFSALKSLYGTDPQTPAPAASTPIVTDPQTPAVTDPAPAAAAPAGNTASAPVPPTPVSSTLPVVAPAPAVAPASDATPAAASPVAIPSPSGSVQIRLRMAYTSFGDSLGPLAQRLAQQGADSAHPALGALFADLSERFAKLADAAGAGHLTLGGFLSTLAQSFGAPAAPGDGAGAANDETPPPAGPPAAAAAPSGGVYRFTAEYRAVFSFGSSDAGMPALALAA